jgi:hypothetical protein
MSKTHTVRQGEHLTGIARANGFNDFHTIWDHPENAALRAKRDPHVLFPGDKLFIPDLTEKSVSRQTDSVHRFLVRASALFLRLRLLDIDGKAIPDAPCDVGLEADSPAQSSKTDGKGILESPLSPAVQKGEVVAQIPPKKPAGKEEPPPVPEQKVKFDLVIGALNPEFKLSGQQARLNNLGYFAGFTTRDLDHLLWAAEEFSCEKISKPVTKRPKIDPAPPAGEDDENNPDPAKPTGIKDAALFNKIKTEHGI